MHTACANSTQKLSPRTPTKPAAISVFPCANPLAAASALPIKTLSPRHAYKWPNTGGTTNPRLPSKRMCCTSMLCN
eukprot:jgi/Psemu1/310925/fgenesh1_kg.697_\